MRRTNRTRRTHRKSPTFLLSFAEPASSSPPASAPTPPWLAEHWQTGESFDDFCRHLLAPAA